MSDQVVARPPHRSRAVQTPTTLLKFRHLLQHKDLTRALFDEINAHLQVLALVVRSPLGRLAGWPQPARPSSRSRLPDRTLRCHTRLDRIQVGARQVAIGAPSGSPPGAGNPSPAERIGSLPALATPGPCGKLPRSAGAMAVMEVACPRPSTRPCSARRSGTTRPALPSSRQSPRMET